MTVTGWDGGPACVRGPSSCPVCSGALAAIFPRAVPDPPIIKNCRTEQRGSASLRSQFPPACNTRVINMKIVGMAGIGAVLCVLAAESHRNLPRHKPSVIDMQNCAILSTFCETLSGEAAVLALLMK